MSLKVNHKNLKFTMKFLCSGGEENLLCYRSDPWRNEDIFLHEFVHGIHNVAIASNGAIKDFDRRISRCVI